MSQSPDFPTNKEPGSLQRDSTSLSASLRELINNPLFSDVKFIVGKERRVVHAHRCILACRCKVFNGMFSHQLQAAKPSHEHQVPFVLADIHPDVFLAVMEYLYTNHVTLNNIIALEVLTSAVEYGLNDLRKAAVTYGQTDLKQKCLAFIERFTEEIIKTQSFRELSDLGLLSILQSDQLSIDEVPLIQAVREWAHVNSVVLEVPVSVVALDVVKGLRLFLLSPEDLTTLEKENMKDELIPESQIAQAWKFHALKKVNEAQSYLFQRRKGTLPREHHHYLEPPSK
ncbi:hypothetical protein XENTR_v10011960 [Xenopus tropicalis]|uniref:BTB domain containing 19 n=1 Tax=Xenopus tropicalis TaxID=8364 RepID=A0A803JYJ3_XENTR|nr:hypothetical protein XENTR_v10011960 [Xenopus tropicalis]